MTRDMTAKEIQEFKAAMSKYWMNFLRESSDRVTLREVWENGFTCGGEYEFDRKEKQS